MKFRTEYPNKLIAQYYDQSRYIKNVSFLLVTIVKLQY